MHSALGKGTAHNFAAKPIRSNPDPQKELKDWIASFLNTRIARWDGLRAVYKADLTGKCSRKRTR
jgi:hypothetical protein